MINACQPPKWQTALTNAITDVNTLLKAVGLSLKDLDAAYQASAQFPLRVPRAFVARMRPQDPKDPLLLQVLPTAQELQTTPGFHRDPVGEHHVNPVPGLLHKYSGRVLLTVTGSCAINCRYCFRRHFPYASNNPGSKGWGPTLTYIANDSSINEVILSGGDPLLAKDSALSALVTQIAEIPHIKRLRIHSRIPLMIPERITESLIHWLTQTPLQSIMVVHCNHANEIDAPVLRALHRLRDANITLFNQAVLLKNINDSATALINLSERLFQASVIPYYLHLLDKVQGAAHFEVDPSRAQHLMREIMPHLPGYLVPKLVREQAGATSKQWIPITW